MYIEGVYRGMDGQSLMVAYEDQDRHGNPVTRVERCFTPEGAVPHEPALGARIRVRVAVIQKRQDNGNGFKRAFFLTKGVEVI